MRMNLWQPLAYLNHQIPCLFSKSSAILKKFKMDQTLSVFVCMCVPLSFRSPYISEISEAIAIEFDKVTVSVISFSSLHLELWSQGHVLQDTGQ